jgi:thiazole synthase ThiGH ThiG subunit
MFLDEARYEDLARSRKEAFKKAFKASYTGRNKHGCSRRSEEEAVRLGSLARELARAYLVVVEWRGFQRTLKLAA